MEKDTTSIKAIVFDIGGVLIKNYENPFFKKWGNEKLKHLKLLFGLGKLSKREFISKGAKQLGISKKQFLQEYTEAYSVIKPNKKVIKLFLNLKTPKYLLSDTNPVHASSLRKNLKQVFSSATKVWLSHEIGLRKLNTKPFRFVIKILKLKPEEILFIDDDKEIINLAKKVGIKTILFKNDKQLFKQLKELRVK